MTKRQTPETTADAVRLATAEYVARIHELLEGAEQPAARHRKKREPMPEGKSRAHDGWKVRQFTTSRKRIPAEMTPRLRAVLQFLIDARKPVEDVKIAKKLDLSVAAVRTALWHLRKNHFAEMLPMEKTRS